MGAPEREILLALRRGDQAIFRHVFNMCYEGLCRYAFTLLRDKDESEDIVQSMFVKFWERREELDIRQSVRSYLYRAVYNQCMNAIEHRSVKKRHQVHSEFTNTNEAQQPEVFPEELDDRIKNAVDKLPPQCRTIFVMSRYEELKYPVIAKKLNISVNTIQNQICKALKILREELKESLDE